MCNNCQNTTCYQCNQPPLCAPNDCSCPVKDLSTDCVLYTGNDLTCSGIKSQTILTELIQQLDEFICTLVEQSINALNLINIGTGADVYKGIDLQGRKEIRRINAVGDLITVTQNPNDISVSIDENELDDFIKDTIVLDNLGSGRKIYKGFNPSTQEYEFRTFIVDSQNGEGESLLRDTQENTNDVTVRLKKIKSNTLLVESNNTELSIELPEASQIPALYVNNLYIPTYSEWVNAGGNLITNPTFQYKGTGTLAKPFTDSIRYTSVSTYVISPETAIQNALDNYVGDLGTYSKANPEKSGQRITIQNNNSNYIFPGDFSYNYINLLIEGSVLCTTTGWLLDMDNLAIFPSLSETAVIRLSEEGFLGILESRGFRNSGNSSTSPPAYDSGKTCFLLGDGLISASYNGVDKLTRYLINSDGNFNDSNLHFQIKCRLRADYQGVYLTKNFCRVDFYNTIQSSLFLGSVDINLQAFRMTGGQVRFYEKGSIFIGGDITSRKYGITFEPQGAGIGNCIFLLGSSKVSYACNYLFVKLNNENVSFEAIGSVGTGATISFPIITNTIVNGLFENTGVTPWAVSFRDCSYSYTGIDFSKVDLTLGNNVSSINTIGNSLVETLVVYNNRANAIAAGIPLYSAFLNRKNPGTAEGLELNPYPLTDNWVRDIVLPA
jgi:hypothetical protein